MAAGRLIELVVVMVFRGCDFSQMTGISVRTIENWAAGVVRRPREMRDVLKVARAPGLDAPNAAALLPPPGCALLITSRQRFTLPGMATIDLEQLRADEAVGLLHSICPCLRADEARTSARACAYLPLALRVSGSILHNDPALLVVDYIQRLADERQRLAQVRDPDDGQLDVESGV